MPAANRFLVAAAGLCGALGVAAAAAASHGGKADLAIAANFLLMHAPVLLGLGLLQGRLALAAAAVLTAGLVLFAGDLAMRDLAGTPLFLFAAPLGGGALIIGWLLLAASAFDRRRG
jgi:uncharacterized membrane protein YgdD (TMEM256/DUF423 family)